MFGIAPYGTSAYGALGGEPAPPTLPEPTAGGSVRFLLMGLRSLLLVILYG